MKYGKVLVSLPKNQKKNFAFFNVLGLIRVNVGEMGHFFSKIHVKSIIHSINKKIVLVFRVTNWLSTVKNSEITIINFPKKVSF
jgi:hypothetical protein